MNLSCVKYILPIAYASCSRIFINGTSECDNFGYSYRQANIQNSHLINMIFLIKKLQSDLNLDSQNKTKNGLFRKFPHCFMSTNFLSQIYATVKGLGWVAHQISSNIKMYHCRPLQHLVVLFVLFDQVVAMTSHLTMPGWHHQEMELRQAERAQCCLLSC